MVNWHQQGCLTHLKDQWLIDAAVRLNPKLRLSPKCQQVGYLNQNAQYISVTYFKESLRFDIVTHQHYFFANRYRYMQSPV